MNSELISKYDMLPEGARVLCAVSGGADSVYLLHRLFEMSDIVLGCAHYNHALRGTESVCDAEFVRELCESMNIPFYLGEGDVRGYARENKLCIEAAARRLRYEFLENIAREHCYSRIATAHTADDNAETILLNLTRGSGMRGLCGIPPVRGIIIRPILDTTRGEIERYLAENAILHVEDSSNAGDDYSRNRLRHSVMPVLRELNSKFPESAFRAAELLREDEAYLNSMARDFLARYDKNRLPVSEIIRLPRSIATRAIRLAAGRGLSALHVAEILRLCDSIDPFAKTDVPGLRVAREYGDLVFNPDCAEGFEPKTLSSGTTVLLPELGMSVSCSQVEECPEINNSLNTFFFYCDNICGNITVRPRAGGDELRLKARGLTKTLKKLFSEAHVPEGERGRIPVVADEHGVLAVVGFGADERCAAKPGERAIRVEVIEQK